MGHALNGSIQDTLIRYARMRGKRTKWILGTDHAGIATQTQVERLLATEGTSREEIGREAFVERVWRWREQYGNTIIDQYKRLGASCDYAEERFTLDEAYVRAVLKVFVALYDKGLIYRDNYMVNWDPGSRSAISDLEVEDREVTDTLYYVDYPLASGHGSITVATVRPETMLGDTAIAVHPDDDRYTRLVGETAILPIVGRRLKIIADDYVKPEFGTGALKITPGHDPNDFEIGRKHGLDELTVIGEDGRMTEAAGERFAGMTALEAREAVVAALREEGRINRTEPYTHEVPYSQRSGERIEPLISLQWFMKMDELAAPAIAAVEEGRVRIHPEGQRRALPGLAEEHPPVVHLAPAVVGPPDARLVPRQPRPTSAWTRPTGPGWERDPDVLDTWFSSALWPFATLGWPDETAELKAFYPTDVLLTARDILFLWVARMVFMGLEFAGDIPFDDVYVHSVVQAPDGRRMSKSLGTGIDPLALIDGGPRPPVFTEGGDFPAYGADAVRYGLLAMSSTQDVRFNEGTIAEGRQLANKLFNASRLVLLRVPEGVDVPGRGAGAADRRGHVDPVAPAGRRGGASRTRSRRSSSTARRARSTASSTRELCDWYLEMLKPRLYAEDNAETARVRAARAGRDAGAGASGDPVRDRGDLVAAARPAGPADGRIAGRRPIRRCATSRSRREVARAIEATQALRKWRDGVGAAPGARVPARLEAAGYERVAEHVARLARFEFSVNGDEPVATVGVPGGNVLVLASDAVDLEAEKRRAAERAEVLRKEIARAEGKLANQGFVAKAPEAVVQAEREKLDKLRAGAGRAFMSDVGSRPRRGAPALARAVRDALRAGAHAPAADGAGLAAGALPRRARRRHQRQVLDRALHRGAARGARRAHGRLPLAAPDVVRRADPDRRRRRLGA